jgi:outer membrane receptor protein involved in Fe transport
VAACPAIRVSPCTALARATAFDGVRDTGAYTRDSFNLERVELIKGRTGAIAGRSATSGAVNQISKTPHDRDIQDYSLGFGSDDYKRVTAETNLAVSDRFSLRLNALYHDAEGIVTWWKINDGHRALYWLRAERCHLIHSELFARRRR